MVALVNSWYVDENGNKWDADSETAESAEAKSKTLVDCSGCSGCIDCSGCIGCRDCSGCIGCRDCRNCSCCSGCRDCIDCSGCRDCIDCSGCIGCRDCIDCIGCSCCRDFKINPQRIVSAKIGSRNDNSVIYWVDENVQVVCGCFRGNIPEFKQAIVKMHSGTEHETAYLKWVSAVEIYMEAVK